MEGSGGRRWREAGWQWLGWVFVGVMIESGDREAYDMGEGTEGGVAEGACEGEGFGGWVAAEMVIVVIGGTEV